jgi:hypothetical protein
LNAKLALIKKVSLNITFVGQRSFHIKNFEPILWPFGSSSNKKGRSAIITFPLAIALKLKFISPFFHIAKNELLKLISLESRNLLFKYERVSRMHEVLFF